MKNKQALLENIGRDFVHSLPKSITNQRQSAENGHFQLSDDDCGDIFLNPNQTRSFYKCLSDVEAALSPYWDDSSLFALTESLILQSIDPKNFSKERQFSKRLAVALKIWVTKLSEPPELWEVYFGIHNLSKQGLPITIGATTFLTVEEAEKEILLKHDEVSIISPDSPVIKSKIREMALNYLHEEGVPSVARVLSWANTSAAASILALVDLRRTLDILNFYADLIHIQPTKVYLPGEASKAGQFVFSFKHGLQGEAIVGN